jgi:hypothetical protein
MMKKIISISFQKDNWGEYNWLDKRHSFFNSFLIDLSLFLVESLFSSFRSF